MPNPSQLDYLTSELAREQDAINHGGEIESFVPRRMRHDRQASTAQAAAPVDERSLAPTTEAFARNALTVYEGIKELQDREARTREALDTANARLEQFEINSKRLADELVSTREQLQRELAERVRLASILENIGGLVSDGLANRTVDSA